MVVPADGRTLRVVADPNPQGGLTYLFDDVSDRLNAESRYNALRRLQAETLDTRWPSRWPCSARTGA